MKIWIASLLLFFSITTYSQEDQHLNPGWEAIQKSRAGVMTVYWYDDNPFVHKDDNGNLKGIEFEIMDGFRKYVKDTFKIDLQIRWAEVESFEEVFDALKNNTKVGIFGCAGFSITRIGAKS